MFLSSLILFHFCIETSVNAVLVVVVVFDVVGGGGGGGSGDGGGVNEDDEDNDDDGDGVGNVKFVLLLLLPLSRSVLCRRFIFKWAVTTKPKLMLKNSFHSTFGFEIKKKKWTCLSLFPTISL